MRFVTAIMLAVIASPALADGGTQVSEPSTLALFALGTLGVIVGRHFAKRRPSDD